jgi:type II secretory pathway pseudopilin PulG
MNLRRLLDRARDDRGYTLSEVIVVGVVTSIILMAIGGMYLSTVQAERTISALSETTTSAQLAARSVDYGVRNGVILLPLQDGTDGGQMVVACTTGADPKTLDHKWQAWYYSPANGGEIRTRTFGNSAAPSVPDADELETWTLLLAGVERRPDPNVPPGDDLPVFSVTSDDPADPSAELVEVSLTFFTTGGGANSTTIDFASRLAPHPAYSSSEPEPCT